MAPQTPVPPTCPHVLVGVPDDVYPETQVLVVVFPTVKALYDYEARGPEELSFTQGELVVVTNKDTSGWWAATLKGEKGVIPSNDHSKKTVHL